MPAALVAEFLAQRLDADALIVLAWQATSARVIGAWPTTPTLPAALPLHAPPDDDVAWDVATHADELPAALRGWLPHPLGRATLVALPTYQGCRSGVLVAWRGATAGPEDVARAIQPMRGPIGQFVAHAVRELLASRGARAGWRWRIDGRVWVVATGIAESAGVAVRVWQFTAEDGGP